ncbi:MAG: DUF1501 domain-containing protein [Pseudomonadota bacterium]
MLTRRRFLQAVGGTSFFTMVSPTLALARADSERRFLFIFLRGGVDGLSAVPAVGDPDFLRVRGTLADPMPGSGERFASRDLNGFFALNHDLGYLHSLYQEEQMLSIHAAASPYRERSHFDAQDVMENGTGSKAERSGFLNRAVAALPGVFTNGRPDVALGFGPVLQLALRGPESVGNWSPPSLPSADSDTIARIADLYAADPVLGAALANAQSANAMAAEMSMTGMMEDMGGSGSTAGFLQMTEVAATFLRSDDGPRVAAIDFGNWDSHANQNQRSLDSNLKFAGRFPEMYRGLDNGVRRLREGLGDKVWNKTVIAIVTEFGRTVSINGTHGTDHGTAGAMFLVGGAVSGGRVIADWPGLKPGDLHESRDLRPTTDIRSVFKGILHDHMQIAEGVLEDRVFPDSRKLKAMEGLIRT